MQVAPSKELLPFIKHYLFLETSGSGIKKLRLFSDGNTGIVFSPGKNLTIDNKKNIHSEYLPSSFLYGQITEFKDLYVANKTMLIIVVFQPAGINKLLGLPAHELRNLFIGIEDILGKKGLELAEIIFETTSAQSKVNILNSFFAGLISDKKNSIEFLIPESLNYIFRNKGIISMSQLVKFTGYTERHLERKFMDSVGVNPKRFINIVKLHNFLKHLNSNRSDTNLTQLSYEAGYADQSHLIKEFKKHTGLTPTLYKDKADKVAVNLVSFRPSLLMSDLYNLQQSH
ncbi:MAG: AraC family transcriptional regulator [Bacteroidetes bacterium]|nr:AraC family transcriptional regulator [Bacteroidota bacterium]